MSLSSLCPLAGAVASYALPKAVDWITGNGQSPPPSQVASNTATQATDASTAPAQQPAPGSLPAPMSFDDYRDEQKSAGMWQGIANADPHGILGGIAGMIAGRKYGDLTAADNYLKQMQARTGTQTGQLGLAQRLGMMAGMGNPVDANNIPASYTGANGASAQPGAPAPQAPPQLAPIQASPNVAPSAQPASFASGTPGVASSAVPPVGIPMPKGSPVSGVAVQPSVDPLAQRRQVLMSAAQNAMRWGDTTNALQIMQQARQGIPAGTDLDPTGRLVDANTSAPIAGSTQQYAARGAGMTAAADANARVPAAETIAGNQAALQRGTDLQRIENEAKNKTLTGFDTATGLPTATTEYNVAHGGAGNFAPGVNPHFAGQQEEIKKLQDTAVNADQGLQIGTQVANAANGIYTGTGAGTVQDLRKMAIGLAQITGDKVPDSVINSTSQFEQLKFSAQELVGIASHQISPRVAMNIYNQIASIKPGDKSSMQGLRDIVTKQLMPAMMRQKAMLGATSDYYSANPLKNDAASAVPSKLPLANFSVKTDLSKVQPGDFFIDPATQNIRQRPE